MSELFDKEVNAQKESLKKLSGFTDAHKKCAMKMKQTNKQTKKQEKNDTREKCF